MGLMHLLSEVAWLPDAVFGNAPQRRPRPPLPEPPGGGRSSTEATMPIFAPPHDGCDTCARGARAAPADLLVGLTAREALERLEAPARKPLRARLWTRLRQAWCDHSAATAHRIPGFGPDPVFERRCGRCKATWTELG